MPTYLGKIKIKNDTTINWAANNPVLLIGEVGIDTTINNLKIGNGSDKFSELPWYTAGAEINTYSEALIAAQVSSSDTLEVALGKLQKQINVLSYNKADKASPTFTGTVVLPSTTSIGNVTSSEIGYIDGVTSPVQTQINERTTYGIYSGLTVAAQSTPNMTVSCSAGVCYLSSGIRYTPEANTALAINAADATNPRIDIIYISSSGVISYLAGTASTTPVPPTIPIDAMLMAYINVAAAAISIINSNIINAGKYMYTPLSSGTSNISLGYLSGSSITTGKYNTLYGDSTGKQITTGGSNTCVGNGSGYSLTVGIGNTGIGESSNYAITSGNNNTSVGRQSGNSITTGTNNVNVGYKSGSAITTGSNNANVGYGSGQLLSTGSTNTNMGYLSGYNITTGSSNTNIGREAGYSASQKIDAQNSTALGYGAYTTADNQVVIGNANVTEFQFGRGLSSLTPTELSYLDGVTSPIQTQINNANSRMTSISESIDNLAESAKSVLPDVSVSTYAMVSTLSDKAREGQMNVTVKGNTLKNSITNGNFATTTGWTPLGSTNSVSNNTMINTGNGGSANPYFSNEFMTPVIPLQEGRKFFIKCKQMVTNSVCTQISFKYRGSTGGTTTNIAYQSSPVQNQWYQLSSIITIPSGYTGNLQLFMYHGYADAATANAMVMEVKDVICIDMGADTSNTLFNKTAAEMDLIAGQLYFDGLTSVVAGQVKSVGKNLLDFTKWVQHDISGTSGIEGTTLVTDHACSDYTRVKPNTTYVLTLTNTKISTYDGIYVMLYAPNKSFIGYTYLYNALAMTFTTDANVGYVRIKIYESGVTGNNVMPTTSQLEEGLAATTYEPYTETVKALPSATLKSLPNGATDYIEATRYVKNCEAYTFLVSDITTLTTSLTNIDYVKINKPSNYIGYGSLYSSVGSVRVDGFTNILVSLDSAGNYYNIHTNQENTLFYFTFPKGTYANLAAAQTALTGTKIIYQLATPVITELFPEPIKSSPKGSIIYENVRREIGIYTTLASVTNTAAPIKTMRKLWKILTDGTKMPLSVVTGITVAGNGLSFTHTNLTANDNVEWEYEFDSALSTTPLIEYGYVNDSSDFPATNLIRNGNFSNGTTGWSVNNAGVPTVSNNAVTFTATTENGNITQSAIGFISGHKYYYSVIARLESGSGTLGFAPYDGTWFGSLSATVTTSPTRISGIGTAVNTATGMMQLNDKRTSGWTAVTASNIILLDLTAIFGAGNEPSLVVMDAIMALYPNSWFDSTVNPLLSAKDMWNLKASRIQENWLIPTMLNSWVAFDTDRTPKYRKSTVGLISFKGMAKTGTIGSAMFSLPAGFRPAFGMYFPVVSYNAFGVVYISSGGDVSCTIGNNTWVDLSSISFTAEA